jgi:ketosteroid isomerase-like protein
MASANIELVKRAYALMATRDWEAAREVIHPQAELRPPALGIDTEKSYTGEEGLKRYLENTDQVWESFVSEPRNFIEADDRTVVVLAHTVGVGRGSGVKVDVEAAHVWRIDEGRILGMQIFLDVAEGFRAAGLD